ncbi:hypothetical protein PYJP_15190 [Pyrofollis japonicus]|uniref:SWIM zinc finger family protein n=1 Tax=Pyrofollis japonicus TaxID=3060460 RepID=UPI0037C5E34D|nr:hypothetical protein PYJP_15190 [Pyrofollis japonicus]
MGIRSNIAIEAARIVNQRKVLYLRWINENTVAAAVRGSSNIYIVHINIDSGKATCTCKGFYYKGYCKHIIAVRNILRTYIARASKVKNESMATS